MFLCCTFLYVAAGLDEDSGQIMAGKEFGLIRTANGKVLL